MLHWYSQVLTTDDLTCLKHFHDSCLSNSTQLSHSVTHRQSMSCWQLTSDIFVEVSSGLDVKRPPFFGRCFHRHTARKLSVTVPRFYDWLVDDSCCFCESWVSTMVSTSCILLYFTNSNSFWGGRCIDCDSWWCLLASFYRAVRVTPLMM